MDFDLAFANPIACAQACASDCVKCDAFSYNPPGMSGPKARCYLKNEVLAPEAAEGVISGVLGNIPCD